MWNIWWSYLIESTVGNIEEEQLMGKYLISVHSFKEPFKNLCRKKKYMYLKFVKSHSSQYLQSYTFLFVNRHKTPIFIDHHQTDFLLRPAVFTGHAGLEFWSCSLILNLLMDPKNKEDWGRTQEKNKQTLFNFSRKLLFNFLITPLVIDL